MIAQYKNFLFYGSHIAPCAGTLICKPDDTHGTAHVLSSDAERVPSISCASAMTSAVRMFASTSVHDPNESGCVRTRCVPSLFLNDLVQTLEFVRGY